MFRVSNMKQYVGGMVTVYVVCGRYVIISSLSKLAAPSSCMLTTINNEPGFSIQAVKYSSWFKFTVCTLVIYTSLSQ